MQIKEHKILSHMVWRLIPNIITSYMWKCPEIPVVLLSSIFFLRPSGYIMSTSLLV